MLTITLLHFCFYTKLYLSLVYSILFQTVNITFLRYGIILQTGFKFPYITNDHGSLTISGPSFGFSTIILSEFILPQTSQVSINTGFFYCPKT